MRRYELTGVCSECGALVSNQERHDAWHDGLNTDIANVYARTRADAAVYGDPKERRAV